MRLATWNVNSIRSRIDRLEAWLARTEVDVLALQESKAKDEQFPYERLQAMGFEVAHRGYNQWNGVAILSRVGLTDVQVGFVGMPQWGDPAADEARAIGATVGEGDEAVRVWSVYVPNGRHLTDPHMDYKIAWLEALLAEAKGWAAGGTPVALCGDWNIAPFDEDVWSMEYYLDKSHVSPRERAAFHAFLDAGFVDVVRPHTPGPGTYTYWDYQRLAFQKRRGMRIDFVLGSPAFADRVLGAAIDREERKGTGASDHAPVVVELGAPR
jgi:exodeoxyribonuclease-3